MTRIVYGAGICFLMPEHTGSALQAWAAPTSSSGSQKGHPHGHVSYHVRSISTIPWYICMFETMLYLRVLQSAIVVKGTAVYRRLVPRGYTVQFYSGAEQLPPTLLRFYSYS